jgi:hypothetical protein
MNKLLCSLAFLALTTAGASAEVINFYGSMCITAASAGCATANIKIGQCSLVRYRPPNIGTNGPQTKFSQFSTASASNYTLPTGTLIGTTFQTVEASHIGQSTSTNAAAMRFSFHQPATVVATSNYINLRGDVTTWDDPDLACDISFRASFVQQPRR